MRALREAAIVAIGLSVALTITFLLFHLPVLTSFHDLLTGAFGDRYALGRTTAKVTPLLLAGLGIAAAWRAGAFNIGGEGQFVVGAVAAAGAAMVAGGWLPIGGLVASVIGGALWAGIAAGLFRWRRVDVIVSTILLNSIGILLVAYLVGGPLRDPAGTSPLTPQLTPGQMLWRPDRRADLHAGFLIALLCVPAFDLFFRRTWAGFVQRAAGENEAMARANRLDPTRAKAQALVISGAMCGLAGGVQYVAVTGQVGAEFAAGWGFLAIPVALLGGQSAYGVLATALVFGALFAGSEDLSRTTSGGATMVYVAQALCLLIVLAGRHFLSRREGGR